MKAAYLVIPSLWTVSRSTGDPPESVSRTVEGGCP